jgi:uncharacterized membrane protein
MKFGLMTIIFIVFLHLIGISISNLYKNSNESEILWRDLKKSAVKIKE